MQQLKEFDGTKLKSTTKEGLDFGDQDEKKTLEELKIESEPLRKLMKEALGDKVEEELQVAATDGDGGDDVGASKGVDVGIEVDDAETALAEQRKEMAARGQADGQRVRRHTGAAAQHRSTQQHNNCHRKQRQQPRKKGEEEEKGQEGRKNEEERKAEEGGGEQVKKDVTGWTVVTRSKKQKQRRVQIFVKVNGSKATPMEVSLTDDKVEDVMRQVQKDEDAYVTMQGKVLKTSEKLKSCGVTDGCTIQVTSRMRGGGKHKDKKSKCEKKQVAQLDDGMCAMACEQMRWMTESVNMLQSTDEDKRRLAEEVEKVRKMMAGMGKQATGGDLQRVAEMEESLKKLEKEVQAKDVDDQKMSMNFAETGEKKVMREGRGCAGLVQGGDETHRKNETSGKGNETSRKGKGKGNGGKVEHGGKGEDGGKGVQQSVKMLKGEEEEADEEDERVQVAPNMGAGSSYHQATTDPEAAEGKEGTRKMRWADCDDIEEEEDHREAVRKSVEMMQKEEVEQAMMDAGEEGWKRKVMWFDCSDEEQGEREEEAGERGERYEVWKGRVSGRVEMWSEENEEPEMRRERERERERRGKKRRQMRSRQVWKTWKVSPRSKKRRSSARSRASRRCVRKRGQRLRCKSRRGRRRRENKRERRRRERTRKRSECSRGARETGERGES